MLLVVMKEMFSNNFFVKCLFKDNKESCTKRPQNFYSLEECMAIPKKPNDFSKASLAILLLLPTIYYMFYFRSNPNSTIQTFNQNLHADKATQPGEAIMEKNKYNLGKKLKTFKQVFSKSNDEFINEEGLPICATGTVPEKINNKTERLDLNSMFLEKRLLDLVTTNLTIKVSMGGHYIPPDCRSIHKIAILVPYRRCSNNNNMKAFLNYIHLFLMRQRLEYRIFLIEQKEKMFNKGRLFNAGFLTIQKNYDWHCFIFHDVDLLPIDNRIRYSCPVLPTHMSTTIVGKELMPKHDTVFNGVTAMTVWHFKKANGYSNLYWGSGESEDMFQRLYAAGLGLIRYKKSIGRYVSLRHPTRPGNPNSTCSTTMIVEDVVYADWELYWQYRDRRNLLQTAVARYKSDGLNSLRYLLVSYASQPLYTHLVIDVDPLLTPDYITEQSVTYKF